ncbi:arginine deiminase [Mycoplasma testudineum]|uniref:Arginine deiminase n=1 Tax=Mycoplasma testudineum TaxID=244584 RepID=A0A4R6IF84_9MOLU|nr:arginine deiminase family protein [Mycoplasma testudineum]OYD26846.1 arginine deiminase [Mycoplasma testudineum]TDO20381.1 arginine deiminase [Mycoplasma testudineum]
MAKINVNSEIGTLREVLVHTPGDELKFVSPNRLNDLLLSAIIEPNRAIIEHKKFIKILEDNGVKVIQLVDLIVETFLSVNQEKQEEFIWNFIKNARPALDQEYSNNVFNFLKSLKPKQMVQKMIAGITNAEMGYKSKTTLLIDPLPNMYFTRDPFASIGNGVSLNSMKYPVRKREEMFAHFIFDNNKKYKNTPKYFDEAISNGHIEGGDIFIYNSKTLVIGNSERTDREAILDIAKNIKKNGMTQFEKIVVINVPPLPNLMHLDTWLTMLDHDKFLYSPNMMKVLKIWEINLKENDLKLIVKEKTLEKTLEDIIGKTPILIPVAGKNATQIDIDVETHFDATNYLVIRPGVVIGYDRNIKTEAALKEAGITVLSFDGNQLSLGMGSARCMSMPLVRDDI